MSAPRSLRSFALLLLLLSPALLYAQTWSSSLYPTDWSPPHESGIHDFLTGAFLQDFSYAGYAQSAAPLPAPTGPLFDAVATYGADPTGQADATAAIQAAIDAAGAAGGGVVWLPAGHYRLSLPTDAEACLTLRNSHVVLRGAGPDLTFLHNTTTTMRNARVVLARPASNGSWNTTASTPVLLSRDEPGPTREVQVADVSDFAVGDTIVLHHPATAAFIADLHMGPGADGVDWTPSIDRIRGPRSLHRIESIDTNNRTLTLDSPTRWYLLTRDGARAYRSTSLLTGVGVEHLSIGNDAHPGDGWAESDYSDPTRAAYDTHNSFLVELRGVHGGWVRDLQSYNPGNANGAHLLSNGVLLNYSRQITVRDVVIAHTQYGGGGGNGYGIRLSSANDCLVMDCETGWMRHGIVMWHIDNAGNVVTGNHDHDTGTQLGNGVATTTAGKGSDHHGVFSHSNLIDANTVTRSYFEAAYRGASGSDPSHALSAAQSVFWNTTGHAYYPGRNYIVHSQQFGTGYVIGTQGNASAINLSEKRPLSAERTDPLDHAEGIGQGATLEPQSLFRDQLARRLGSTANWLLHPITLVAAPSAQTAATGADVTLSVSVATGPGETPHYQWFKDNTPLPDRDAPTLQLTNLTAADAGSYHVTVTDSTGRVTSPAVAVTVTPSTEPEPEPEPTVGGRLSNESVLTTILPDRSLTVGFTLETASTQVLLRGVGPSLATFIPTAPLADPRLTLHRIDPAGATLLALNTAWGEETSLRSASATVGAFPLSSPADTALLEWLAPGNYTAVLTSENDTQGPALVELYLLPVGGPADPPPGHLVNLSALRLLDPDTPTLTAGFVLAGDEARTVLLRAVGPSLAPHVGTSPVLADPLLTLHHIVDGLATELEHVDDWSTRADATAIAAAAATVGAFALSEPSEDAALLAELTPGSYTVRADRQGTDTGLTLVEVYLLP
ncbi:glycosyl hydrolase family 28-related protein [Actomonas aquatica]|uniref:Glycosyl hydrolase family 28-related protein n=1 Tax=Actomonas aquatica TaxID=2866162 RepID=A0ABZ1C2R9_9BACT|nr:glycosyl hydrolase family 28-related protein [Opitutus sp. WL0086]WRQ85994.1 glycosyl hydrolase family 28-related protein [Opitutus sp. WL0086]